MMSNRSQHSVNSITHDVDRSHVGHNAQHCEHVLVLEFRPNSDFMLETLQFKNPLSRVNRIYCWVEH